jgi:maltooligosyltrehalose synthase
MAFVRQHEGKSLVVLAPRLTSKIGFPPVGPAWGDTAVQLAGDFVGRNIFTGEAISTGVHWPLSSAFASLPFAVLSN